MYSGVTCINEVAKRLTVIPEPGTTASIHISAQLLSK